MITFNIDADNAIIHIHPEGRLQKEDFAKLTQSVNSLIESKGAVTGIMIETESFPGWENFGAMIDHFKFVKDHHKKIKKIALVTNTKLANFAEKIVSHFVVAEIKKFPAGQAELAKNWLMLR